MSKVTETTTEALPEAIDLFHLLDGMWKGLQRHILLLALLILLGAGAFYGRARLSYRPQYLASATFTVTADTYSTSSYYNNTTASQLQSTFPYLLTSGSLSRIVAEDLGVASLNGSISASVMPNTNLFTIEVRSSDPQAAGAILESVIENYPQVAEQVLGSTVLEMLDNTGVPTEPYNPPAFARAAVKGGGLGLGLGILFLLAYALTRQTVQRESDVKKFIHAECLSSVPQVTAKKRSKAQNWTASIDNPHISQSFLEAIRLLRTRLERSAQRHSAQILLVTSTAPGEGKSTIAANTAMALAMNGKKVLLMDCDIRNPSVGGMLGLNKGKGVYELLSGEARLEEVFQYDKTHHIYVLPGGTPCSDASEILDSNQMRELLQSVRSLMDYVILDTAPVGMLTDTAVLAELADGALFVVKQDYAKTSHIVEAVEQLAESRIPMLGCVLNGVTSSAGGYGYGYGDYGYRRYGSSHYSGHYGGGREQKTEPSK